MNEIIDRLLKLQTLESSETADAAGEDSITKLRAEIPAPILAHYDRLGERGKKGVAAVRNSVCTGCHVHVPIAVTVTLMRDDDIQICESCGRYLYLTTPAETPKAVRRRKAAAATSKDPIQLQTA